MIMWLTMDLKTLLVILLS